MHSLSSRHSPAPTGHSLVAEFLGKTRKSLSKPAHEKEGIWKPPFGLQTIGSGGSSSDGEFVGLVGGLTGSAGGSSPFWPLSFPPGRHASPIQSSSGGPPSGGGPQSGSVTGSHGGPQRGSPGGQMTSLSSAALATEYM